jgi:hypothetical protein
VAGIPQRLVMLWKDRDGDIPFTVDSEDDLVTMLVAGAEFYAQQAEEAYHGYLDHIRDVDVRPQDMRKATQGQPSADPDAMPDI